MDFRFPRERRLVCAREYRHVFQSAIKKYHKGVNLYFRKNQLSFPRLGIIIAKKEIPKACQRNRFKRLIRESFRRQQDSVGNFDIIVMVKRECLLYTGTEFYRTLEELWQYCMPRPK